MYALITTMDKRPPGLRAAEWRNLLRAAWFHAMRMWFRFVLPKHFTHRGATEYGYQERSVLHTRKKLRKFGHTYPNVFTGKLRAEVLANATDIRATAKGVRGYLHGPKYLWQYRKNYSQPDKAKELTAVSDADREFIAEVMDKYIARQLRRAGIRDVGAGHAVPA